MVLPKRNLANMIHAVYVAFHHRPSHRRGVRLKRAAAQARNDVSRARSSAPKQTDRRGVDSDRLQPCMRQGFPRMFGLLVARRGRFEWKSYRRARGRPTRTSAEEATYSMSSVPCSDDVERTRDAAPNGSTFASRWLFARLSSWLARVPLPWGHAIANGLAWPHYALFGERRRGVLANLAVLRPDLTPRERRRAARRVTASYNKMLFEFFRLPRLTPDALLDSVEVVGFEHIERSLALGRGVILTSSHVGNWELGAVIVAMRGHRVHAVAGVQLGRWLSGAIRDAKNERAVVTVAPEDSYRKLFRALRANDIVGLMVDGDIFSNGIPVEFFGRTASWPAGPGVLAKRTHAPVVCGYCERTVEGTFRIILEPALDPDTFASANDLNVEIARTTERHIAAHAEQWCIFRPFWDTGAVATQHAGSQRGVTA